MKKDGLIYKAYFDKEIKFSIRLGRLLLAFGSIFLFISGLAHIIISIISLVNTDYSTFTAVSYFLVIFSFVLYLFMIFSSIGGVSFSLNKGPFLSLTALTAIVSAVFFFIWIIFDFNNLFSSGDWESFLESFASIDLSLCIYFIGWFLAKDYLD